MPLLQPGRAPSETDLGQVGPGSASAQQPQQQYVLAAEPVGVQVAGVPALGGPSGMWPSAQDTKPPALGRPSGLGGLNNQGSGSPNATTATPNTTVSPRNARLGVGSGFGGGGYTPPSTSTSRALPSPAAYASQPELWEREIESLDAKEVEIHQTQLRLMREQIAAFRESVQALRADMTDMQNYIKNKVEVGLNDVTDAVQQHAGLHQDIARRLAGLEDAANKTRDLPQQQDVLAGRIQYMENFLSEESSQSLAQMDSAHNKLDQLNLRVSACEAKGDELARNDQDQHAAQNTLADKINIMDQNVWNNFDKITRDLNEISKDHINVNNFRDDVAHRLSQLDQATIHGDAERQSIQRDLTQRLNNLQNFVTENLDQERRAVKAVQDELDRMSNHADAIDSVLQSQHLTEERMGVMERAIGESADKFENIAAQLKSMPRQDAGSPTSAAALARWRATSPGPASSSRGGGGLPYTGAGGGLQGGLQGGGLQGGLQGGGLQGGGLHGGGLQGGLGGPGGGGDGSRGSCGSTGRMGGAIEKRNQY